MPAPGAMVDKGTTVLLYMDTELPYDEMEGMTVVPDVSGKTIMEAAQLDRGRGAYDEPDRRRNGDASKP